MSRKTFAWIAGGGCLLILLLLGAIVLLFAYFTAMPMRSVDISQPTATPRARVERVAPATPMVRPTLTPGPTKAPPSADATGERLSSLYERVNPGVVHIMVFVDQMGRGGQGTGSGFVLDTKGHIVTNNHVVDQAEKLIVVFYDGYEAEAEVLGRDPDSDLAVIRVDDMPEGVHELPLGDSDAVSVGEGVIAIGSPFGLGASMTSGIVSAKGRTIPSGVTPFSIPQAIQTDAAINPGNSGGPLLNMHGQVIGVNAQIASGGVAANAGVGFAIPSNVVARVVPVLIEYGVFDWPWLGVTGTSVGLTIQQANDLDVQEGAYIDGVVDDGPADEAGMRGSTGTRTVGSFEAPVGGDVVIAVDGRRVRDFSELLTEIASRNPGDEVTLTVVRDGRERTLDVVLAPRPRQEGL